MTTDGDPTETARQDAERMGWCLEAARLAALRGEVPVGCMVVDGAGEVLGQAHNLRELLDDPTAHAEVLAMRHAAWRRGSWRLDGCTLYVTLEPCPMCAGALVNARIARVVYGCDDPRAGAIRSLWSLANDPRLNHRCAITAGVRAEECAGVLREFFRARRGRAKVRGG